MRLAEPAGSDLPRLVCCAPMRTWIEPLMAFLLVAVPVTFLLVSKSQQEQEPSAKRSQASANRVAAAKKPARPAPAKAPKTRELPEKLPPWRLAEGQPTPRPPPPPNVPANLDELKSLATDTSRCAEVFRKHLIVFADGSLESNQPIDEALSGPSTVEVTEGRHRGQRGLPLEALLGSGAGLEVWPCIGEVQRYPRSDLRADPQRYLLVKSGKDTLKLVDRQLSTTRPVAKNLAVVRRLPAP
jgi:hypothetical protein